LDVILVVASKFQVDLALKPLVVLLDGSAIADRNFVVEDLRFLLCHRMVLLSKVK